MKISTHSVDYVQKLTTPVKQLPENQAAQLYTFARFLLAESRHNADDADEHVGDSDLAAEDAQWEAALMQHADTFAELKAQARADIAAGKAVLCEMPARGPYD